MTFKFFTLIIFCFVLFPISNYSQNLKVLPHTKWKNYEIGMSDMMISFPGEPEYSKIDTSKLYEQYNYRFKTDHVNDYNFMYFISVVKNKSNLSIDSIVFKNLSSLLINNLLNNSFKHYVIFEENGLFKKYPTRSTKAILYINEKESCVLNSKIIWRNRYIISMFVLAKPDDDDNLNMQFYFKSINWTD